MDKLSRSRKALGLDVDIVHNECGQIVELCKCKGVIKGVKGTLVDYKTLENVNVWA